MHNSSRCIFIYIHMHTHTHTHTFNSLVRAELNTQSKHFLQSIIMQYSSFLRTTLNHPTSPVAFGVSSISDTS